MLTKLTETEISNSWDAVINELKKSLGDFDVAREQRLFLSLTQDRFQLFIGTDDEQTTPYYLLMTTLMSDTIDGVVNLVIYAFSSLNDKPIPNEIYRNDLMVLRGIAKRLKANGVVAYTDNVKILEVAKNTGAEVKSYINWRI